MRFLDEWAPQPVLLETPVASRKWSYCGTFDAVFDLPDGQRVIADIKTSRSGIWPETALQLAAYRYAEFYLDRERREQPLESLGITSAIGIWVRADDYDVVPIEASEEQFGKFLHIAVGARWQKNNGELIGAPIHPGGESAA